MVPRVGAFLELQQEALPPVQGSCVGSVTNMSHRSGTPPILPRGSRSSAVSPPR